MRPNKASTSTITARTAISTCLTVNPPPLDLLPSLTVISSPVARSDLPEA